MRGMPGEYVAAARRRRPKTARVDLGGVVKEARSYVEPNIAALSRLARAETEIFLAERERRFKIPQLLISRKAP